MQNGFNMDGSYDFKDCIGLKVKARKGDGLLFYSMTPNLTIDAVSNNYHYQHPNLSELMQLVALLP